MDSMLYLLDSALYVAFGQMSREDYSDKCGDGPKRLPFQGTVDTG